MYTSLVQMIIICSPTKNYTRISYSYIQSRYFLMPGAFWTLAPGKLKVRTHIADKSCESIKAFHMGDLPWDIGSRQSCQLGPILCRNTFPASQRICTPRHPPGCTAREKFRRISLKMLTKSPESSWRRRV